MGANLVRALLEDGHELSVLDDLSGGRAQYLDGVDAEMTRGNVADARAVRRAARRCHAVVHLAAMSGVAPSVQHPGRDFEANVLGTFNVLEAARREGVRRVVFASSGAVLAGARPPLEERAIPQPLAPYGASKLYGEYALQAFQNAYDLSGVTLRFSNVYGPYCSHKRSVVAAFLRYALHRRPLVIYGSGRQTRDFLHVSDVTRAVLLALRSTTNGVFQLGTGVETNINRLARLVSDVAGVPLRVERRPPRAAEAARNYADITRARRVLRFRPRVDLARGLADTMAWMLEHEVRKRT